jgi:UDP-N-acetylglucosamine 2-epimerase (non-hydrolysing)
MFKILHVVGARPNFMKLASVYHALSEYNTVNQEIIHSGQHHDVNMSDVFFVQLSLPFPNFNLGISGGSSLSQLAKGIIALETFFLTNEYDLICVYGDVNATAFGAITANKLGYKVAHIEAGLRSFDTTMPEETNRILTDCMSHYYFTPSEDATKNLLQEGKSPSSIFMVGNVMIDSIVKNLTNIESVKLSFLLPEKYALVTLHRPANVDDINNLFQIVDALKVLSEKISLVFPVHPRTKKMLGEHLTGNENIILLEPLDYFTFVKLQKGSVFVLTDSGGVQEETTFFKVPCFTLRTTTERPITVTLGSNTLISNYQNIIPTISFFLDSTSKKKYQIPPFWDGNSGVRIADIIVNQLLS